MNKIIIDNDKVNYDFQKEKEVLNIKGKSDIFIKSIPKKFDLEINVLKSADILVDLVLNLESTSFNLIINSYENSKIDLNMALKYQKNSEINIYNNILQNNTNTSIKLRCVENDGNLKIKAIGNIKENLSNNNYLEDIRAIVSNQKSITIMPDLKVASVSLANHNTTISNINEEELFYLESKGINRENAVNIIKEGFLKGILNERRDSYE